MGMEKKDPQYSRFLGKNLQALIIRTFNVTNFLNVLGIVLKWLRKRTCEILRSVVINAVFSPLGSYLPIVFWAFQTTTRVIQGWCGVGWGGWEG